MTLTAKQREIIKDNLKSYLNNFGSLTIEKTDYGPGFYVFRNDQERDRDNASEGHTWIQFCYNIDYLNGWLYGAVQAANGIMKRINKEV